MVGNMREYADAVYADGAGGGYVLDNGADGIGLGTKISYPTGNANLAYTSFDMWRGIQPFAGNGSSLAFNSNRILFYNAGGEPNVPAGGPFPMMMGGDWWVDDNAEEGRFTMRVTAAPDNAGAAAANRQYTSARCAYGW